MTLENANLRAINGYPLYRLIIFHKFAMKSYLDKTLYTNNNIYFNALVFLKTSHAINKELIANEYIIEEIKYGSYLDSFCNQLKKGDVVRVTCLNVPYLYPYVGLEENGNVQKQGILLSNLLYNQIKNSIDHTMITKYIKHVIKRDLLLDITNIYFEIEDNKKICIDDLIASENAIYNNLRDICCNDMQLNKLNELIAIISDTKNEK